MPDKKLVFMPGCFDSLPDEEAEDLMKELQRMFDDGSFFENSIELDLEALKEEEPEAYEKVVNPTHRLH